MKVYELMQELAKLPAGDDILVTGSDELPSNRVIRVDDSSVEHAVILTGDGCYEPEDD